ncbi:hypothetical protein [Aliagarivorans taiwanensis]|uniref:hypothetical protein n=1 Tax=Aliagarivorans taiwanensis TaxID=561966 RepID=UPI00041C8AFF|nr:hypothetical protein [Aliagarivorans taiwanensis]
MDFVLQVALVAVIFILLCRLAASIWLPMLRKEHQQQEVLFSFGQILIKVFQVHIGVGTSVAILAMPILYLGVAGLFGVIAGIWLWYFYFQQASLRITL